MNGHEASDTEKMSVKEFLMRTTNGMALGLFGTLIIGTILSVISDIPGLEKIDTFATLIKSLMGAGIGLGVALSLKKDGIHAVVLMAAGMAGTLMFEISKGEFYTASDPLSCYVCTVIVLAALSRLKKTSLDLILVPLVGLVIALLYCIVLADPVHHITLFIGDIIKASFELAPLPMCIIVCVLVGMALTAPISSVAICVAIQIGNVPLAAGAALIGCCVQMVGFAVHTAHDNGLDKVIAVGIGTSMLQFKNIIRKPVIWLPTIITSAILAPFAYFFSFKTDSVGAGMGTSGFVGLIDTFKVMSYDPVAVVEVVLICVVAAIAIVFVIDRIFRKMGIIKTGDFNI